MKYMIRNHNLHHQQLREELQFKKPMVFRARAFLQKIGLGKSQVSEKEKGKKINKNGYERTTTQEFI